MDDKEIEKEDAELNALLGKTLNLTEIVTSAQANNKNELAKIDSNALEEKILYETNDIMQCAKDAVTDVLLQVQTTPSDGELVSGAARLLNSYNMIIDNLQKIYTAKEKFKQQVKLQSMKLMADDKINQDNNATRVMMSREQLLAVLSKNTPKGETIDMNSFDDVINTQENTNESDGFEEEI